MPLVPEEKLRNHQNRRVTKGLFQGFYGDPKNHFFTLNRWDMAPNNTYPEGLISFQRIYLEYCLVDPTEYTFAIEVFGDWEHWEMVQDLDIVKPVLASLRKERDIAIRSRGFLHIAQEVESQGKNSYAAAKWLAEKGWEAPETSSVRVRTKAAKAAKEEAKEDTSEALLEAKRLATELGITIN